LTSLEWFSLDRNAFMKSLPSEIGSLTLLTYMALSSQFFNGYFTRRTWMP
jgi:hypothetical protein